MKIIDRLDCAVTRAQLAAMGTIRDASQYLRTDPDRSDPSTPRDPEEGATTVEYAIGTIAAAGFAGLLIVVLKSDAVRAALESLIQEALNTR